MHACKCSLHEVPMSSACYPHVPYAGRGYRHAGTRLSRCCWFTGWVRVLVKASSGYVAGDSESPWLGGCYVHLPLLVRVKSRTDTIYPFICSHPFRDMSKHVLSKPHARFMWQFTAHCHCVDNRVTIHKDYISILSTQSSCQLRKQDTTNEYFSSSKDSPLMFNACLV